MKIETLHIADLKPYDKNARTHPQKQIDLLAKNIMRFGFTTPVLIDDDNNVIAGHGRLLAMQQLSEPDVPCVRMSGLTKAEVAALRLADNKIAELGEWDMELALPELKGLEADLLDLTGFSADLLVEPDEKDDVVPENAPSIAKLGDLWALGRHRVLCGNSTDLAQVERLMDGARADMVFTDPPYSSGGSQESGKTSGSIGARGQKTIKSDNLSTRGYKLLMQDVLSLMQSAHSVFVFCDWKMWTETFDVAERAGYRVRNMIVWDKMQMGMGMPFRNQHELCLFASKIAGKIGNGTTANVLQHKRDREAEHATPKPVGLIIDMLSQVEAARLYDPFLGSGSTLIAAEKTGRVCYGMELDPKYVDVIIKRWEDYTNGKAEKIN